MEISFDGWVIEPFLVKKRKNNHTPDSFEVEKLNLNNNLKEHFLDNIKSKICDDNDSFIVNLEDFHDFMSDDNNNKNYKISKDELDEINTYFSSLIDKLNEEQEVYQNNFAKTESTIVLKISYENQSIYYFRKLKKVLFAGKNIFSIFQGSIKELDKDILTFDDSIDFVYFDEFSPHESSEQNEDFKKKIIIFNRRNFELIFMIKDYCIKKSREFFDKFDFIQISNIDTDKKDSEGNPLKLRELFIQDGVLNRQLTRIFSISKDEISFEKIKALKEQEGDLFKYQIENDKVKIETREQIKDLIDLIDEKIATPLWNTEKKLRFPAKGDGMGA